MQQHLQRVAPSRRVRMAAPSRKKAPDRCSPLRSMVLTSLPSVSSSSRLTECHARREIKNAPPVNGCPATRTLLAGSCEVLRLPHAACDHSEKTGLDEAQVRVEPADDAPFMTQTTRAVFNVTTRDHGGQVWAAPHRLTARSADCGSTELGRDHHCQPEHEACFPARLHGAPGSLRSLHPSAAAQRMRGRGVASSTISRADSSATRK